MGRKEITLNLHSSVLEVNCFTDNLVTLLLSNIKQIQNSVRMYKKCGFN